MRVFVTGGSGFIGGHLIERLVREGHGVSALARSSQSAATVERRGARAVSGDLDTIEASHLAGCEAVIHCAARAEDWGSRQQFFSANVEGTRRLLAAARAAGARRFVHVGTEAALFTGGDLAGVDESIPLPPPEAHRFLYPESKAEAERLVVAANSAELRTVVIRPRLVWGPGDTSVMGTVREMAEQGGFWWLDQGRHTTSTCHVDNLGEALLLALERGEPGRAYFVTDGQDQTMRTFLTALMETQGVRLPERSLPGWLGRAMAWAIEGVWGAVGRAGRPPITRFAISMMSATVTVRDAAARRDLGYRPIRTVAEGMAELRAAHEAERAAKGGASN